MNGQKTVEPGPEPWILRSRVLSWPSIHINHQLDQILQDIFRREPDVIAFSCYIWNIEYIRYLIADLGKILPDVPIWLGGPEVSFDAAKVLGELPEATGVMKGEGEETFAQLAGYYVDKLCEKGTDSGKILPDGQGLSGKYTRACLSPPRWFVGRYRCTPGHGYEPDTISI